MDERHAAPVLGQAAGVSIHAPIDRFTHHELRAAVLELREAEPRRRFPMALHAGLPGAATSLRHVHLERADEGLARDLALILLDRARRDHQQHFCWLTRPGALTLHDADLFWGSAVHWAAQALSSPVSLVAVTREGWFCPTTGVTRTWRRLRRHSPRPSR